jgi:hypothetical protein
MAEILDYITSILMGGMLTLNVLSVNQIANETYSLYSGDMSVQEMLVTTVQVLEGEFRNMGFGVPENERTVLAADTSSITFLMDLDRAGTSIDTIRYSLGPISDLSYTQNVMDRYIYRTVNGTSTLKVGVVTTFRLRYITPDGEVLSTPVPSDRLTEIHEVEITMEVQNPYAMYNPGYTGTGNENALFSSSYWQQTRLASQNSRR